MWQNRFMRILMHNSTLLIQHFSYFLSFGKAAGHDLYVKMRGTNIVAPYKMIFYVVILLYGEWKGSLLGHKLVKPGHYLENSLICLIFQSALLTVWFAAHFILCHGMISTQT